jgi:hypothetical protein
MTVKPFASLSSGLLARKGQAKPAMRPQGFGHYGQPGDDLGWNDMGYDAPRPAPPSQRPAVVVQQEELAASFAPGPVVEKPHPPVIETAPAPAPAARSRPASRARKPEPKPVEADGRKAAFTLRLDADRHLRLRLASAVGRRSSQQLVTEALDALLASMPELGELAAKAKKGK